MRYFLNTTRRENKSSHYLSPDDTLSLPLCSACKRAYAEKPTQSADFELKKINISLSPFEISA